MSQLDIPDGLAVITDKQLDLSDVEVVERILGHRAVDSEKNIWAFWHTGWSTMRPWNQRNVIAWARRLEPNGWKVR